MNITEICIFVMMSSNFPQGLANIKICLHLITYIYNNQYNFLNQDYVLLYAHYNRWDFLKIKSDFIIVFLVDWLKRKLNLK